MSVVETTSQMVDINLQALKRGSVQLATMPIERRIRLVDECLTGVVRVAKQWVELSWEAKKIPAGDAARAEDMLTGPLPTLRYLWLLRQTLEDIGRTGAPQFPSPPYEKNGQVRVPIFPTRQLFDSLLFGPLKAETWMAPGIGIDDLFGKNVDWLSGKSVEAPLVGVVLGAGNVSSIPIIDALSKIFQENHATILKMNPVNEYMGSIFETAFSALVVADIFRVAFGGHEVGSHLIQHPDVDVVHITGSDRTHDAIVWGRDGDEAARRSANTPLLKKPITSELGNVSPWIVVPGNYTQKQLNFQAENIVASITNNASFNCIATKMLITSKDWPQRKALLDRIEHVLKSVPRRFAYYPGAGERYARFSGESCDDDHLPWKLRRDVTLDSHTELFREESFVCVVGETSLDGDAEAFLPAAIEFANEQMWGTLSVGLTVPDSLRKKQASLLDESIKSLRYGTIGVNQWPGVAYAMMSAPWGALPGSTLADIQSGIGHVHNTFLMSGAEKTVLSSPLTMIPKPMWFSTHRCPEAVASSVLRLYEKPSLMRVPKVLLHALRG